METKTIALEGTPEMIAKLSACAQLIARDAGIPWNDVTPEYYGLKAYDLMREFRNGDLNADDRNRVVSEETTREQ